MSFVNGVETTQPGQGGSECSGGGVVCVWDNLVGVDAGKRWNSAAARKRTTGTAECPL